jgi:hypothetical protein
MKTKFFFFAMLASVVASAQVTNVAPISANYTNKTVSFRVWWNAGSRDATHLSKVWVWVDYIQINSNNTTSGNTWTRATVGTISGGTTAFDGSNRKGFWLEGNASTNYSATLTVELTNVPAKFNWCAYVSDYPPFVIANNGTYTLQGTPPFILKATNGTSQTVTGKTLPAASLTIDAITFTDKTECPADFCLYTGSDLYRDATHLCGHRPTGARNWEAWIKDTRDGEIYRIVQYSNGVWWWADDYRGSYGYERNCSSTRLYSATNKSSDCPSGWRLPSSDELLSRFSPLATSDNWGGALSGGNDVYRPLNGYCSKISKRCEMICSDKTTAVWTWCEKPEETYVNGQPNTPGKVRCIRSL